MFLHERGIRYEPIDPISFLYQPERGPKSEYQNIVTLFNGVALLLWSEVLGHSLKILKRIFAIITAIIIAIFCKTESVILLLLQLLLLPLLLLLLILQLRLVIIASTTAATALL